MPHEFETGFFVGQPAWHGLGTVLPSPPSVDDAIKMAGLNWRVVLGSLYTKHGINVGHKCVMRDSDNSILGVVGPEFTPVQNSEAFGWFQPFVDSGAVTLEAAGSLREGKRVWILAKVAGLTAEPVNGDPINRFFLLAHGHDGSLAIRLGSTDVRVCCANTLSMAISGSGGRLLKIKHTKNVTKALELVREIIDVQTMNFQATMAQMQTLARYGCDDSKLRQYVREIFSPEKSEDPSASKTLVNKIFPLFESGRGTDIVGVRGTMYGAFNAVTEYLTHERGRSADNRVDSIWFGPGANDTNRALTVALAMCA
jgi:phage/plasmid-like protein (TIGR03299 family)